MSNIDKQALREAAEKALNARTRLDLMESVFDDDGDVTPEAQDDISICMSFNDLTNPATVLALLDELEAAEKRIAELREWNLGLAEEAQQYQEKLSEMDSSLCELLPGVQYMDPPDGGSVTPLEQVRRMVADYREQIAELEQRQSIKPCPKCNDTGMADSGGTQPWGEPIEIKCDCRHQDANIAELVAAGIITRIEG